VVLLDLEGHELAKRLSFIFESLEIAAGVGYGAINWGGDTKRRERESRRLGRKSRIWIER